MINFDSLAMAFSAIGHISFALTFLSYAQREIIRLRMIAVASLLCGLIYNGWVQSRMTGDDNIWLVIFWLSVFLIQNIILLVREIRAGLEMSLPAESRSLMVSIFPMMHSRDWHTLVGMAQVKTFSRGTKILDVGEPTTRLQLIVSGTAIENRNGVTRQCGKGTLWGELTYVMGDDQFNASPVSIVTNSETLVVYSWSYAMLRELAAKNLRLHAALQHGFVYSAGLKHGLLWVNATAYNGDQVQDHLIGAG
jgi:hypothetical protein